MKERVYKVVSSCTTTEQLRSAIRYSILAGMRNEPIIDELI